MKKWIPAIALCLMLCLFSCFAAADGTGMTMPDPRQVQMLRIARQGETVDTVNVTTPVGQNIGAIKMTVKDTNGWHIIDLDDDVQNVSDAVNGKLTFLFSTRTGSSFEVGHQYLVELMAIPMKENSDEPNIEDPTSWESYWSRILTVVPDDSLAGLQVYINGQEDPLTTNGYTVETGYYGIYITAYDPSAQNVWIVLDGEAIQGYDGNSMSFCAGYDKPGTHKVYAVSMNENGIKCISTEYTIYVEDIGNPTLYGSNIIPVTYSEGGVTKSLEEFPNTITAGTDISYTVHYVRRTDLGQDAAGLEQQIWYDSWLDDLTDWEGNRELPCYKKRQEPEVPYGPLMNAETGDQTITIDHSDLQVGHTYRLSVEIRSAGRTPVRVEKTFTVLPAQMNNQNISLSFRGDAANQTSIEVPLYGNFELHASAPGATVVRFWNGDGFEYLNHWIGGDWTGGFDFEWSSWGSGERQFYIQAYYGELNETPWDQMDWDPACISNILTVNTPEGNASDRIAPDYTTNPTGHTITQGEYYTVTLLNAGMLNQAGAYVGADVNNGDNIWNHYDAEGDQIMIPTADLEPGYYTLAVYSEIPGAGYAQNPSFFRVAAPETMPEHNFMITTTATAVEGIYTAESYEDFSVTFYAPDMEGYWKYYRFFDGRDWWWEEWMDRSVTLNLEQDPGEYEIYAEVVYVPDDEEEDEIRFESEHLQFAVTSEGSSGITLEAPGSYVIKENSTGYTASIVFPAGFDASRAADEYWELVLQTTHGPDIMRFGRNNGDNPQLPLTFPAELFEAGETYRLWLHMNVRGYDHVHEEVCFAAFEEPDEDQPALSLTVNGEVGDVDVLAHENIRVQVEKDDSITAVRMLNGDYWEVWWGGDNFRRDWTFGGGVYGLVAQGTTVDPFWDEEGFDWEGFDWNEDVSWTVTSNVVTVKATTPNGKLNAPTLALDKDTYTRGETITATVGKVDGSEWYNVHIQHADEYGNTYGDWVYDGHADATGDGELVFTIPTNHIEGGRYAIWADNNAVGYQGNSSEWKMFTVTQDEEYTPQAVLEIPEEISTNQNIEIYAYVPGADDIWLDIRKAGDDGWWNDRNSGGDYAVWEFGEAYRGTYIFTLYGHVNGEEVQATDQIELEVLAPNGSLEDVSFSQMPDVLTLGSNNGISGSFTKADHAEWYQVRLVYRGPTGNWGDEEIENFFAGEEYVGDVVEFAYGPEDFDRAGVYEIQVFGGATGYNGTDNRRRILVIDAPAESDEYLTLTVNGSGDAYQDYLSSQNMKVKVGYQTRPTAVRILNGDFWEYWWGEGENFQRDWGFGDGETFMYAEATWEEINFDTFTESDWDEFNWDEDLNWCGRSNIIVLNISSPYGEMTAPTYTLNTENGQLAWGEDLVITIEDEGPTGPDAEVLEDGWFFFNLDVERWNEYGPWWDRVSNNFNFQVRSGVNRIPTYMLDGGCRYRIEIGADGEGYGGRSTWTEFTLGEKPETQNEIKYFRVNGSAAEEISVQTHEELQLAAYYSNAEWYGVEITREDDEGWQDYRNDCRSGMLIDWWRSDSAGTYTLTAYGYGNLPEGQTNEYGDNFWREEIGAVTVTVTADHGDLGDLHASMTDLAYMGDSIEISFEEIGTAAAVTRSGLNPAEVEYSYWIHSDKDNGWIMGESRYGAGTLTIDTDRLNSGVYWVELDAMANGYNQSHATLHFALLDGNDTAYISETRYFTISALSVPTETDAHIIAYLPGADGIQLWFQKDNNTELEEIEYRDGPGVSSWLCRGDSGNYSIYVSGRFGGSWTEPAEVCQLTITAENSFTSSPVVTVNDSGEGNIVPADQSHPQRMTIVISRDPAAEGYHVRACRYGDGWPVFEEFISLSNPEEDERISIFDDMVVITIEDERIQEGQLYEIDCWAHATGYECAGSHRLFLLQEGTETEGFVLTVSPDGADELWTAQNAWVYVRSEGATGLKVCMNNEVRYYHGDRVGVTFTVWDPETIFHAYATTNPVSWEDDFDWDGLDWSRQAVPVTVYANTEGPTDVPSLTFDDHVTKGDWFEFTIGDEGDARQMDIRIRDEWGNEVEFRRYWAPGTYMLPTAKLNPGQRYWVELSCVQDRHMWTNGPRMELYVDEPGEAEAFFKVDKPAVDGKAIVYPGEPFVPSAYAPGANHIWIGNEDWIENPSSFDGLWGDWDGDNATNGADWEWWYDDPGEYTLVAWAQYEGTGEISEIGRINFQVLEPEPLERAEIIVPDEVDVTEVNCIYIDSVPGGYYYKLQLHYIGQDQTEWYSEIKTIQDIDTDRDHFAFVIPAGTLRANQSYWVDCYVDPANRDYAHTGSDSSKNFMTRDGNSTDLNLNLTIDGEWEAETEDDYIRYLIPINTPFGVTVTAGPTAGLPSAIAVYMGDHTEYRFFNDGDGSANTESVGMSEWQAWPENIFARAFYGDLSMYDGENVPWDDLEWSAPSNVIHVRFTSGGQAEPASIFNHWSTITGHNIVVQVTLGNHANEAHANLDRNTGGEWINQVFGDWIGWEEDPENPGTGTITIPTEGLSIATYRLHVDNSGPGYENGRTTTWLLIVEDPYQAEPRLELPAGLTMIEEEAFAGIAADTVIIPEGVTTIGRRAFADSQVRLVVIPESVTEIGEGAFANSKLEVVYGWNDQAALDCATGNNATFCFLGQ